MHKIILLAILTIELTDGGGFLPSRHAPIVHPSPPYPHHYHHELPHFPNYSFGYAVNDPLTGDVKHQQESRNGDNVDGEYSLIEPDGHKRIVHYHADGFNGFNAIVQREGHTHHYPPRFHHPAAHHVPIPHSPPPPLPPPAAVHDSHFHPAVIPFSGHPYHRHH